MPLAQHELDASPIAGEIELWPQLKLTPQRTLFVALPVELQRTIEGGCSCPYCKSHPNQTPMWDTLAIDAKAQRHTWIVHYPEMRQWR